MTNKDTIIDRLLHQQLITPEEAKILREKEYVYVPSSPYIQPENQKQFQELFKPPHKNPFDIDFERRQSFVDTCPCNPKNGGSGICNCTMGTMPVIC